jgi:hypothetical protein
LTENIPLFPPQPAASFDFEYDNNNYNDINNYSNSPKEVMDYYDYEGMLFLGHKQLALMIS